MNHEKVLEKIFRIELQMSQVELSFGLIEPARLNFAKFEQDELLM